MYRILIVEDDSALRYLYSRMKVFSECGFHITAQAEDGRRALEVLQQQQFDLILTDIRMPFIDGLELIRKLKERGITTPTVLVSSYDEFEYARQGMILGAFDYIVKPISQCKLAETLSRIHKQLDTNVEENTHNMLVQTVFRDNNIGINENSFLEKVNAFIAANLQRVITMDDIAIHMGISKDYFGKMFKQYTGFTFGSFYSQVKIAYAKYLIRSGQYKAYQISEILGYSSPDYFRKIFKELTGMTPSMYKEHS